MDGIKTPADYAEVVGTTKIHELRQAVDPVGKKSTWLKVLNDTQLAEIFWRLHEGEAPYSVTRMIQKLWKIKPESDPKSLSRSVSNFYKKTVGELRREITAVGATPKEIAIAEKKVAVVSEKVEALNEYIWMIQMQKNRIKAFMAAEDKSGVPYNVTDKAMTNFREMLDGYTQLCVKLGILDQVPPEINIKMKHQFESLMQVTVKDDKPKLIRAVDTFLEQLDDACVLLTHNEDGTYQVPDDG